MGAGHRRDVRPRWGEAQGHEREEGELRAGERRPRAPRAGERRPRAGERRPRSSALREGGEEVEGAAGMGKRRWRAL